MLNHREMFEHAVLSRARCRALTLLAAIATLAVGIAALGWMIRPEYWVLVLYLTIVDMIAAAIVSARLVRINRRLEQLETFI